MVRWFRDVSSTPLGWCVTFENEGYLAFLLRAGADPEVRNSRGLRPIDMAGAERIRGVFQQPTLHVDLPEDDSELFLEHF